MNISVCAIVVTYNRRLLLEECLRAVLGQTRPVATLIVIDNASSDGTAEMLQQSGLLNEGRVQYVALPANVGGAGGFRRGLETGLLLAPDWLWLMDDDTIPSPAALEELLSAEARFPATHKPSLLASKVEWTDGKLHPMNFPTTKRTHLDPEEALVAAECGTIALRWASFVSVLLRQSAVQEHGLPHGDYFIWNDDTEYTARILRQGLGVLVPKSIVTHKTSRKHSPMDAAPERAYYQVRNVLWMILRSQAWRTDEKLKIGLIHSQWIVSYLLRARFCSPALRAVGRGLLDGTLKTPRG